LFASVATVAVFSYFSAVPKKKKMMSPAVALTLRLNHPHTQILHMCHLLFTRAAIVKRLTRVLKNQAVINQTIINSIKIKKKDKKKWEQHALVQLKIKRIRS
jgi:hypothetical protein